MIVDLREWHKIKKPPEIENGIEKEIWIYLSSFGVLSIDILVSKEGNIWIKRKLSYERNLLSSKFYLMKKKKKTNYENTVLDRN